MIEDNLLGQYKQYGNTFILWTVLFTNQRIQYYCLYAN